MNKAGNFSLLSHMAWKNIRRNKRRTFLSGGSLFLVSLFICLLMSMEYGSMDDMKFNIVHHETGVIRVRNPKYTENERINPLNLNIEDTESVIQAIESVEGVTQAEPKISTGAIVYHNEETTAVPLLGMKFETSYYFNDKDNQIVEGSLENATEAKSVVITEHMANHFGFHAGDKFTFMARTASNGTNALTAKIAAIVHMADGDYSGDHIFMEFSHLSKLLRMDGNTVELLVFTDDWTNDELTETIIDKLKSDNLLSELEIIPWFKGNSLYSILELSDLMYFIYALVFFLLSAIVIFNSTLMSVMERKKEIGSLLSFGMSGQSVVFLFLLETIFISAISAFLGSAIAAIIIEIFYHTGINLAGSSYDTMEGFNIKMMLYPHLSFGRYVEFFFTGFFTAVIACIFPSRMALNVQPAEALRSEN